jgi:hypothetical protein
MKIFKSKFKNFKNLRSFATNQITRGKYAQLNNDDIHFFEEILTKDRILTDSQELGVYNSDWMKKYKGNSPIALFPTTTEQVSKILSYCNEKKLAVVPQGESDFN